MNQTSLPAIDPNLTYPIETAKAFFGKKDSWTSARRNGLAKHVKYIGRKGFISGKDLAQFIQDAGKTRDYSSE
ncbi:MAG: hypothetical protein COA78_10925 [Blastopirellula sp.]|nr:MAG: hypothetical protein COA78_10925 [Blastopirellula sp.]